MLGVDAIDNMLFGGSDVNGQMIREATFNSPDLVNGMYRKYDRDFDPAALARAAGRKHTFGVQPRRLTPKPRWDWVVPHCHEKDDWLNKIREVMVKLPSQPKWLVQGYEACGVADVKRPMLEMLREALNHHDRIPHAGNKLRISAWVKHVVGHYKGLEAGIDAEYLFFAPAPVRTSSRVFSATTLQQTLKANSDFGVWGSHVVEMPDHLHKRFCKKVWPLHPKARRRKCPERVVNMGDAVYMASRERVLNVPLTTWKALLKLVEGDADPANEELLAFGWHMFLGQPAVLSRG